MTNFHQSSIFFAVSVLLVCLAAVTGSADQPVREDMEFFENNVRPLLVQHCYDCHSANAKKVQGGLLVDSRNRLLQGGDSGAAIEPGDIESSLLIQAVRYESYEMPPKGKLSDAEIKTLEKWVAKGAVWPAEVEPEKNASLAEFDLLQRQSEHWVWQPIQNPPIPAVLDSQWPANDLDCFILSRLESNQLEPSSDVDRAAWLRRIFFDLIGLPPTPEQLERFLSDDSPVALEKWVDELLASPQFGERWGRHWLDLVRYAESRGHEFEEDIPNAYQYRDYVIRALNADVPYDQWVREQIAGDLLAAPRLNPDAGYNESVLGTGFWFLGEWTHSPVDIRKDEADRFDNMIDVMSKTFLGVTVACARCHDHKFDAISTADYYSLCGFLQSSDYHQVRFESMEVDRRIAAELHQLDLKYQAKIVEVLTECDVNFSAPAATDEDFDSVMAVDYGKLGSRQFLQDGFVFGARPRKAGEAYLVMDGAQSEVRFADRDAAVNDLFWNGMKSISEKPVNQRNLLAPLPGIGRTLRTPTFTLASGDVACRVRGAGHVVACVDSHRMIAGPLHGETIKKFEAGTEWVQLKLDRYVGHRLHLEFIPTPDQQLEVSLVTQGASLEMREQLLQREREVEAVVATYAESAATCLAENGQSVIEEWVARRKELQSQVMLRSHVAIAMKDGTSEDDHVLIRGNAAQPGPLVPRHFISALAGEQPMKIHAGSGRLELAERINRTDNPLTSRVIVNRIWHHLMGRGIVATTDDFGVLGQRPTHPELLDHLASHFLTHGRSIKEMIRYIVLSRTYRMSSHYNPAAWSVDPKNEMWHYRPPKRLEGEVIRDSLLAISGKLDPKMFGPSVPVFLTSFMDGRGKPPHSGPADGAGRRSIYVAVRRNFVSPFMLAFDTPSPFSTMGRRNVSNVPAQALILMNDPFVVDQASQWAKRMIGSHDSVDFRIAAMYGMAFARLPTERERSVAEEFLKTQAAERNVNRNDLELWANFAHGLINTKEFIFLK